MSLSWVSLRSRSYQGGPNAQIPWIKGQREKKAFESCQKAPNRPYVETQQLAATPPGGSNCEWSGTPDYRRVWVVEGNVSAPLTTICWPGARPPKLPSEMDLISLPATSARLSPSGSAVHVHPERPFDPYRSGEGCLYGADYSRTCPLQMRTWSLAS